MPLYFEDLIVGEERVSLISHVVTPEEIKEFAGKWDPQPFHVDEEAAAKSAYGGLVASSAHIFAINLRLGNHQKHNVAALAGLGMEELVFRHPVRPGDRLSWTSACTEKRVSRTRPDRGIITTLTRMLNQNGDVVMQCKAKILVKRREPGEVEAEDDRGHERNGSAR